MLQELLQPADTAVGWHEMCFSPQADLVGGIAISAIGVVAIRNAQKRHRDVALSTLPLLLGAHQIIESFVWFGLQGHEPHLIGKVALWAYLLIAFVVLPIFVPLAVVINEPSRRRRFIMAPLVALGIAVSTILLVSMLRGPVSVQLRAYHLAYSIDLNHGALVIVLYVVAICGTLLLSTRRRVVTFGIVNVVAVGVIAWLTVDGFASVWCGWAAITSGAIALHMRVGKTRQVPPLVTSTA